MIGTGQVTQFASSKCFTGTLSVTVHLKELICVHWSIESEARNGLDQLS